MNAAGRALVLLFVMAGAATVAFGAWGTTPGANGDLVFRRYFDDSHTVFPEYIPHTDHNATQIGHMSQHVVRVQHIGSLQA